jgi:hypothetical protein
VISPARVDCPTFYCLGGYDREKLKPFSAKFVTDVPAHEAELIRVLKEDRMRRTAATQCTCSHISRSSSR